MSILDIRRAFANRHPRWPKTAWMVLAATAAIVVVGTWFFVGETTNAPFVDILPPAGGRHPFSLAPHASPRAIANVEFQDGEGRKRSLADFRGKVVLLNIWATWCSPCRQEMPTLDRLQEQLGGPDFEVVALSIDRGGQAVVKSFFDETDMKRLAVYVDATAEAGNKLGILGVPTTLLLDRTGREIARVTGPAEWDSAEVIAAIRRRLPPGNS